MKISILLLAVVLNSNAWAAGIIGDTVFPYEVTAEDEALASLAMGPFADAQNAQAVATYDPFHSTTYFSGQPKTIAFASCNFQRLSQDHFKVIASMKPDVWVWLGDIIYADILPMNLRRGEYRHVKMATGYQQLRKESVIMETLLVFLLLEAKFFLMIAITLIRS